MAVLRYNGNAPGTIIFSFFRKDTHRMMIQPSMRGSRLAALLSGLFGLVLIVGCSKSDSSDSSKKQGPPADGRGPGPNVQNQAKDTGPQFAAGRKLFETNCAKCHSTDGRSGPQFGGGGMGGMGGRGGFGGERGGGRGGFGGERGGGRGGFGGERGGGGFGGRGGMGGMSRGPDLSKAGSDPKHTRQWLIDFIKDPTTQKERTRMPKFKDKLKDEEIGQIADYVGSLKG
jgi:mono/diheme cytochrome c family protein